MKRMFILDEAKEQAHFYNIIEIIVLNSCLKRKSNA